jgi:hypothetical protein
LTGPNAGLEEPALGGPTQEAAQLRLFTASSFDVATDVATALDLYLNSVDSPILGCYTSKEGEPERIC